VKPTGENKAESLKECLGQRDPCFDGSPVS